MNEKAKQLRAVIYTRVSTDEQTKGYGLEYQLEDCRRVIAEHGHSLVEIYSDPGISGTVEDRPGLNRLRHDAQRGTFDILYFWKSDRLARDEIIQLTLYREFKSLGVETHSVSEPNMNDLMRGIYAVFGAEDLRNIKAKMYSGRIRAWKDGKWIGSPPYGYFKDTNHKLLVYEPEACRVRALFEWFVRDRLAVSALAKRAYEQSVPTRYDNRQQRKPRNGSGFWSQGTLTRLLSREYYATGEITVHTRTELGRLARSSSAEPEKITILVPPLISRELFEAAQQQLRHNQVYARRRSKRTYLFAKKLRCGTCGIKLSGGCRPEREDAKFYRGDACCREIRCASCRYYRESTLDAALWPRIKAVFENPSAFLAELDTYRKRDSKADDLRAQQRSLLELESKIDRQESVLLECELDGFYTPSLLAERRAALAASSADIAERRLDVERQLRAEAQKASTIASAARLYEVLRDKLENASYNVKERVYQLLVDRIVLTNNDAEVWLNIPGDPGILIADGLAVSGGNAQSYATPMYQGMSPRLDYRPLYAAHAMSGMRHITQRHQSLICQNNTREDQAGLIIFHADLALHRRVSKKGIPI